MFNSFWLFFTKSTQVTILYFYFVKKSVCSQYPLMPFNIGLFLKSRKGSKDMYNVLNRKTVHISAEQKWEKELYHKTSRTLVLNYKSAGNLEMT
jgi:hypothetical protein